MFSGMIDYFHRSPIARCDARLGKRTVARNLQLFVELAPQGSRRCRRCAAVRGHYECRSTFGAGGEWRFRNDDLEIVVRLLSTPGTRVARLQATIALCKRVEMHARLVYGCDLRTKSLEEGPWMLSLISERTQCAFVFPDRIEITLAAQPVASDGSAALENTESVDAFHGSSGHEGQSSAPSDPGGQTAY